MNKFGARHPLICALACTTSALWLASPAHAERPASHPRGGAGHLVLLQATASSRGRLMRVVTVGPMGGALHTVGVAAPYSGVAAQPRSSLLALGHPAGLYLLHITGGQAQRLRPVGAPIQISAPAWSSDGRRLAFLASVASRHASVIDRALWIADRDGRHARQVLTPMRTADLLTVTWAPDSRSLLLSRFARGQGAISRLDLRSHRETALLHGFDAVTSPDGRQIAYDVRGRPGTAHLWLYEIQTQHTHQLIIQGLRQAAVPVWAPDSRSLAFFGTDSVAATFIQPYGVWIVSPRGGRARLVVSNAVAVLPVGQESLAWTPQ